MYKKERKTLSPDEVNKLKKRVVHHYKKNMYSGNGKKGPRVNDLLDLFHTLNAKVTVMDWSYNHDIKPKGSRIVTKRRYIETCKIEIEYNDKKFDDRKDSYFLHNFYHFCYECFKNESK